MVAVRSASFESTQILDRRNVISLVQRLRCTILSPVICYGAAASSLLFTVTATLTGTTAAAITGARTGYHGYDDIHPCRSATGLHLKRIEALLSSQVSQDLGPALRCFSAEGSFLIIAGASAGGFGPVPSVRKSKPQSERSDSASHIWYFIRDLTSEDEPDSLPEAEDMSKEQPSTSRRHYFDDFLSSVSLQDEAAMLLEGAGRLGLAPAHVHSSTMNWTAL
ncbi:hypothetical protein BDZ89DRAFT_1041588 [Hymenopellis radicata]|nr:hypothetical protein BDZ89DRAFT_1041588 [Hymenopellis radicata]